MFTPINSELRNFSSDKMTLKFLIFKYLKCHLSFVTFAFTLRMQQFASCLWIEFLRDGKCSRLEKNCMVLSYFDIPIVCLSLAIVVRIYDKSKMNLPCSTVPHSFILRSIPYCFRINPVSFPLPQ